MKTKFKIISLLTVTCLLLASTASFAVEKNKDYHKAWPVGDVNTLEISNKFGEIKINNDGGSEVTIDVEVTVEGSSEKRVNDILDKIDVEFSKSGKTVKAITELAKNFNSKGTFSIDYTVNIPSDKNLIIKNRYGNTIVNELNANGNFEIKYGNFTANELNPPGNEAIKLELSYGSSSIGSASNLDAEVNYSPITIEEIDILMLESKYSTINLEEVGTVTAESKYDKLYIEEIESLNITTKYTHIRIEELAKKLKVQAGYGGIKVAEVGSDFESINITNSYGQISLGLDDASYSVDASCDYCGVSYPENKFKGDKIKESHTQIVKGKVGSGNGGTIVVKSRYGSIKLND